MTTNPRRPGFRLPWSGDADASDAPQPSVPGDAGAATSAPVARPSTTGPGAPDPEARLAAGRRDAGSSNGSAANAPPAEAARVQAPPAERSAEPPAEPPAEFLRDLVSAMRSVAESARTETVAELHRHADERVQRLQAASEDRAAELRRRAETDVTGIGEWARAEAERIRAEAEGRVTARRAQLEQQLTAESRRVDEETNALRARLAEYERELEAYHAGLAEISDPAAFAAAAKRIPRPPELVPANPGQATQDRAAEADAVAAAGATDGAGDPARTASAEPDASAPPTPTEEALSVRLAELDAALAGPNDAGGLEPVAEPVEPSAPAPAVGPSAAAPVAADEPSADAGPTPAAEPTPAAATATPIIVKGLGSFGAITGFRQSLAGMDGIEGVSLSLGPTGEFVYRATHAEGFDVAAAIRGIEGEAVSIERHADGTLRVTVTRGR